MDASDFEQVIEQCQLAIGEFPKGNPEPMKAMFSHQEDVTLANLFGPPARGWEQVAELMERDASYVRDGEITGFEPVAKYVTPELAYIVWVERLKAKVSRRDDITPYAQRVTMIFRPEDGVWKGLL